MRVLPLLLLLLLLPSIPASARSPISVKYFYDPLCSRCEDARPVVEEVVYRYEGKVHYEIYNLKNDEGILKAKSYGVFEIPSIVIDETTLISYEDYNGNTTLLKRLLLREIEESLGGKPVITIEKRSDRTSTAPGDLINVTITLTNTGNRSAEINATERLTSNATLIGGETSWNARLKPHDKASYTYQVRVEKSGYGRRLLSRTILYLNDSNHTFASEDLTINVRPDLSPPSILLMGLFAGLNPCLFAIIAFIASITLASTGKRRNVLYIVIAFSSGIFTTYLIFGIGLLEVIGSEMQEGVQTFLVLLIVALGLWQVYDAYHIHTSEKNKRSTFRTPKIFTKMTERAIEGASLPASFILGSLFSLIKAPCVGAIYLAILEMIKSGKSSAMLYLAIYNLGVMLPVLLIGAAIATGLAPEKVESFREEWRVALRIITGITLFALAALIQLGVI
ncbi:Cytochrome C biogenesis protein transmembrane region [Candidatus Methanoperedenaceae archaeon GB37]|nr:Cytochrome C biogenesis protein transmembrane region [Candidatus Methanoperedenaceae archaeon GB37]